jgi:hypothetical protein
VCQVLLDRPARKAPRVNVASRDRLVLQASLEFLDRSAQRVHRVNLDRLAQEVHRDRRASLALKAYPVMWVR